MLANGQFLVYVVIGEKLTSPCAVYFVFANIYIYMIGKVGHRSRGRLADSVFTNGPGDLGSILGRVIQKTLKMVLDTSLLRTHQYKVRNKVKWSTPGKGVVPSPTARCSSYWKGSILVALDYGRQLTYIYEPRISKLRIQKEKHLITFSVCMCVCVCVCIQATKTCAA